MTNSGIGTTMWGRSDIDSDLPHNFMGDPTRTKQIFANLISNALKFTHEGHVLVRAEKISASDSGVDIAFTVEDTGIGIAKDKQQKVFEKFSQAEESTTRKFGGTGLGLAIVSQLIEIMGGQIGVESEEDKGSKFKFNVTLEEGENQDKSAEDLSHLKVLIVDDCEIIRTVLSCALKKQSISNDEAESAEEALEHLGRAAQDEYDVCLIDYNLSGMNGMKFAEKIREQKKFDKLALIMVSGAINRAPDEDMKAAGLDGFFGKVLHPQRIIEAIKIAANNRAKNIKDAPFVTEYNVAKILGQETVKKDQAHRQYPKKHVLAVDDTKMNMMVIKKVLSKFGLQIDTAINGLEALKMRKEKDYDAIFMDCQMSEMDGFESTEEIRKFEDENDRTRVPVIALTADAMVGDREKCLSVGMDDYINKPFKEIEIADALSKWIDGNAGKEAAENVG